MNIQIAKLILVGFIPLAFALGAVAQDSRILAGGAGVESINVERTAKDRIDVSFDLDLSRLDIKNNKACLLTPVLDPWRQVAGSSRRRAVQQRKLHPIPPGRPPHTL